MAADRHRIFGLCHLSLERTRQGLETCFSYQNKKKELLESITRNEAKRETAAQYMYSWVHFEIVELVASKKRVLHLSIDLLIALEWQKKLVHALLSITRPRRHT